MRFFQQKVKNKKIDAIPGFFICDFSSSYPSEIN